MKLIGRSLAAAAIAGIFSANPLLAGDAKAVEEKVVVKEEEARKWWGASLSTGWDSLYMFRRECAAL
jgi:hypothetical protein